MPITYAGIELTIPTPEMESWIAERISTRDVYEFAALHWPGTRLAHLSFPGILPQRPIKLGCLHWPVHASRWAVGHFIVSETQLAQIRQQTTGTGTYRAQTLSMIWNDPTPHVGTDTEVARVEPSMYMLPARPLSQFLDTDNGHYLLTLVCERFFWWFKAPGSLSPATVTTWALAYSTLGTALGVTVNVDSVASAYSTPPLGVLTDYEYLPLKLDEIAQATGRRIVRRIDGTVYARSATNSQSDQQYNIASAPARSREGGGEFGFNQARLPNDFPASLPSTVTVSFPRDDNSAQYTASTTLATLALSGFPTFGNGGVQLLHHPALATFTTSTTTPSNSSTLATLVTQAATDSYYWSGYAKYDLKLWGIVPWTMEGLDDVEYVYAASDVSTRVQPAPSAEGSSCECSSCCDDHWIADYATTTALSPTFTVGTNGVLTGAGALPTIDGVTPEADGGGGGGGGGGGRGKILLRMETGSNGPYNRLYTIRTLNPYVLIPFGPNYPGMPVYVNRGLKLGGRTFYNIIPATPSSTQPSSWNPFEPFPLPKSVPNYGSALMPQGMPSTVYTPPFNYPITFTDVTPSTSKPWYMEWLGKAAGSTSYNGSTSQGDIGTAAILSMQAYSTIAMRFMCVTLPSGTGQQLYSEATVNGSTWRIVLNSDASGIVFAINTLGGGGGEQPQASFTVALVAYKWYSIVCTLGAVNGQNIYVDGVKGSASANTSPYGGGNGGITQVTLGCGFQSGADAEFFSGNITDFLPIPGVEWTAQQAIDWTRPAPTPTTTADAEAAKKNYAMSGTGI